MIHSAKYLLVGAILAVTCPQGDGVGYKTTSWETFPAFFDRSLIDSYESLFGESLDEAQQEGFLRVVRFIKSDREVTDLRWAAYLLATVRHETAFTWRPIREFGQGRGREYGTPDPDLGETYYGRGYVQLTWKENYERAGRLLGKDFVRNPDKTLDPETAYQILSRGMREGWFTGRALEDYIADTRTDYVNARRVVNGTDRAENIAAQARKFESLLRGEPALRDRFPISGPVNQG